MLNTGLTAEQVAAATKVVPIDSVRPHPRNPNRGSVPAVRESLRSHGIFRSIVVQQSTGYVLAGNTTWAASKAEGLAEVPIIELPVSDDEAVKIMLVDNRAAQIGDGYDDMVLAELLRELPDLEGTGWDESELDALLEEMATALDEGEEDGPDEGPVALTDDDAIPDPPADTITRPGDLWLLGPHRLLCGDSTIPADVARAVGGLGPVTMLHADPPYGMGKEADGVLNDNLYREKLDAFQARWWSAWVSVLAGNGSAYIWGNAEDLWRWWWVGGLGSDPDLTVRNELVWNKLTEQGTRYGYGMGTEDGRMYANISERCLFLMRGAQQFNTNADNYWEGWEPIRSWLEAERDKAGWTNQDANRVTGSQMASHYFTRSQWSLPTEGMYEKLQEAAEGRAFLRPHEELRAQHEELRAAFYATRSYFDNTHENMTDVWDFPRVTGEDRHGHATPKPVSMIERAFASSSRPGDVIGVPFGGSGPEFIAAHHLDRVVVGMELDPGYCDVIAKRYEAHTGITPLLVRGGVEPAPVSFTVAAADAA